MNFRANQFIQSIIDLDWLVGKLRFFVNPLFVIFLNYRVEKTEWNDVTGKWTITTSTGKKYLANFVFSASGALHIPNDTRYTGYLLSEDIFILKLF